jgi:hypothetical protein
MRLRVICELILSPLTQRFWFLIVGGCSLASFGGAGGQHACEIAQILGIETVLIHRYSSILSAYGLALADR